MSKKNIYFPTAMGIEEAERIIDLETESKAKQPGVKDNG